MADAMDSKSISRKGVGVRVPALAPGSAKDAPLRALAEDLGRALAPSIAARIGALGERYQAFALRLGAGDEGRFADALFDESQALELARDEAAVVEAGYVLGVLAAACGLDVLRARRLDEGPRVLVELVARRFGRTLDPPVGALPLAAADAGGGWEGTFALGALFAAAAGGAAAGPLGWRLARAAGAEDWTLDFRACDADRTVAAARAALAASGVRATGDGGGTLLPGAWFRGRA